MPLFLFLLIIFSWLFGTPEGQLLLSIIVGIPLIVVVIVVVAGFLVSSFQESKRKNIERQEREKRRQQEKEKEEARLAETRKREEDFNRAVRAGTNVCMNARASIRSDVPIAVIVLVVGILVPGATTIYAVAVGRVWRPESVRMLRVVVKMFAGSALPRNLFAATAETVLFITQGEGMNAAYTMTMTRIRPLPRPNGFCVQLIEPGGKTANT